MKTLRLALGQINPVVGDLKGNTEKVIEYVKKAKELDADMVIFPELVLCGYPPEDLLYNRSFINDNIDSLERVVSQTKGIVAVVGFADAEKGSGGRYEGGPIYNAAAVIANRNIAGIHHKAEFSCGDIFYQSKYFSRGEGDTLFELDGCSFSLAVGSGVFHKAELIVNIDGSVYCRGGNAHREKILRKKAVELNADLAYVNITGGQDEWVFEGGSAIIDRKGHVIAKSPLFAEDLLIADIGRSDMTRKAGSETRRVSLHIKTQSNIIKKALPQAPLRKLDPAEEVYDALVMATRDYIRKNGFQKAVLGISGGIDSTLVAMIAKDALGKENVIGISMPTRYTSDEGRDDAARLAKNLGIALIEAPIDALFEAYLKTFKNLFGRMPGQLTQENIQPRSGANIRMRVSNNYGWLVLATGNKSEVGTGYSTIYGDTAGGFAVIKDVPKTLVYKLVRWANKKAGKDVVPARILTRAPTAELKHGQKDTDSLPSYEILDPMLTAIIEDKKGMDELVKSGYDTGLAKRMMDMVCKNEYKRRQSPIGPKITKCSFGKDWNFPITNKYR